MSEPTDLAVPEFTPAHRGGSGSPLVLLHGFTDTWRSWDLVIPALEREHDVLAPTLAGHAGGPELSGENLEQAIVDAAERALDEAGFETAHLVGNSLGGFVALGLAARGRARTVTAIAPAGGWPEGDPAMAQVIAYFRATRILLTNALPHADAIAAMPEGRARATEMYASSAEHFSPELVIHQMHGAYRCPSVLDLARYAEANGWQLDAERIGCPVRIVWGSEDRLLVLPTAAVRFREEWLPQAEWIELEGAGHCPQLDHPTETAQLILDFAR
jgi:pimeloyl-ACP methyl ester carboxylesterase